MELPFGEARDDLKIAVLGTGEELSSALIVREYDARVNYLRRKDRNISLVRDFFMYATSEVVHAAVGRELVACLPSAESVKSIPASIAAIGQCTFFTMEVFSVKSMLLGCNIPDYMLFVCMAVQFIFSHVVIAVYYCSMLPAD